MADSTVEVSGPQRFIKLVVIGDKAVGKTCLLTRYHYETFPFHDAPMMSDYFLKNVQVPEIGHIQLALFYTNRAVDYERLRLLSYPTTDVVLICFSIANPASLNNVEEKWIQEVRHHLPDVPVALVGCQTDLRDDLYTAEQLESRGYQRPCSFEEGKIIAQKIGAAHYVECSALVGDGVTEVFVTAIRVAVQASDKRRRRYRKGGVCAVF
ncbi:ras-related C3 botulinum toxin substrate 1 [Flagelloscypha sp. PMI_526]|nr:ras-related C3 botulinum toxin substrate 1 [Flagelloscypha sp. PMI_526]